MKKIDRTNSHSHAINIMGHITNFFCSPFDDLSYTNICESCTDETINACSAKNKSFVYTAPVPLLIGSTNPATVYKE